MAPAGIICFVFIYFRVRCWGFNIAVVEFMGYLIISNDQMSNNVEKQRAGSGVRREVSRETKLRELSAKAGK